MPDSTPKQRLDLEDLALHEGATVLLRRILSQLSAGESCEVHGDSPEFASQLSAWCRKEGLRCDPKRGAARTYRIESASPAPAISTPRSEVSESAALNWGLAPRGARIEQGGPDFGFTLRKKRDVWARELGTIYSQAVANQWSASRDIPWAELPKLPTEVEAAVAQIMTFLTENEFAALYVPARFIPRIHPHYREVVEVLAMQIVDEARHAEAFNRRAEAGGAGLGTTAISGQLSLKTLLGEPDFTTATFLLCVMGEGTFLTLLKFLGENSPPIRSRRLSRVSRIATKPATLPSALNICATSSSANRSCASRWRPPSSAEARCSHQFPDSAPTSTMHWLFLREGGFPSRRFAPARERLRSFIARWIGPDESGCNRWGSSWPWPQPCRPITRRTSCSR